MSKAEDFYEEEDMEELENLLGQMDDEGLFGFDDVPKVSSNLHSSFRSPTDASLVSYWEVEILNFFLSMSFIIKNCPQNTP